MSSNALNVYNSCAFCRANGKPWIHAMKNKDDQIICPNLLSYKCPFCKEYGHTTKHCNKLQQKKTRDREREQQAVQAEIDRHLMLQQNQNRKQEDKLKKQQQEQVRKAEFTSKSWASMVTKTIPQDQLNKINDDHIRLKKETEIKRSQEMERLRIENKQRWENWYRHKMPQFYGLKQPYGQLPKGSFWEFFIEGKKYNGREVDHEIAKNLRDNEANQKLFIQYLDIKYFDWRYDTEGKEDDCLFVWRHREADRDFRQQIITDREEIQQEREREREQAEQKERAEMEYKLLTGEITHSEFQEWENAIEEDLIDALENYSARMYAIQEIESRRYAKWKNIKEDFETKTNP